MCGSEDTRLIYMCKNGHAMHPTCLGALIESTYPEFPPCPVCRNRAMYSIVASVMTDLLYLQLTPISDTAAITAMMIGQDDFQRLKERGLDPRKRCDVR